MAAHDEHAVLVVDEQHAGRVAGPHPGRSHRPAGVELDAALLRRDERSRCSALGVRGLWDVCSVSRVSRLRGCPEV